LREIEFRMTAFARVFLPTRSPMSACRAGLSTTVRHPRTRLRISTSGYVIVPVSARTAKTIDPIAELV
jgi:hypothetical protein